MSLINNFCRNRNHLRKYIRFNRISGKYLCSSVTSRDSNQQITIKMPKRIERGPTDILRALADTVGKDYTAPHYRYHDDPYLTPVGSLSKRAYAFSKESGRRAARYFFDTYPDLFFRDDAEPKIELFSYPEVYDENTPVDEQDLKKCIIRSEVFNAIAVYNNLKRDNINISSEILHELLELTCFYNSEDPLSDEYLDEKWFGNYAPDSKKMWNEHAFAEQLFNSIEEKTSQTYCAIIMGMAKYNHAEKAYNYYQLMREKNLRCNVETYNSLIRVVSYLREGYDTRWALIEELLRNMVTDQLKPNLGTLNSILEQLARIGSWKYSRPMAKRTLVEMVKNLGITPCLATYKHILNIYCRERGNVNTVLYEIMDEIEDQDFEAKDVKDILFFVTAMDISCNHVCDLKLAYRVHDLLCKGKNDKFITLFIHENSYYNNFFKLLCFAESIDKVMEIYNKYVPNVFTPTPNLCANVIEAIDLNEAYQHIRRVWKDIDMIDIYANQLLYDRLIKLLSKTKFADELQRDFVNIATIVLERGLDIKQKKARSNFDLTGQTLGNFIIIFLNGGEIDKAYEVIKVLEKEQYKINGYPDSNALTMFCKLAIDAEQYTYALHAIRYSNSIDAFEVARYAITYCETINLDEQIKVAFEKMRALGLEREKMLSTNQSESEPKNEDLDEETNKFDN